MNQALSVSELTQETIEPLLDYWMNCTPEYLHSLGATVSKMPSRQRFKQKLTEQLYQEYSEKQSYALIWYLDDKPIGHTNVNKIKYGNYAYMHIHLWYSMHRKKGYGTQLIKKSVPYFFNNLKLDKIMCEPYSLNDAPNNTLIKAGFTFMDGYKTTPGSLNYEQIVHLYELKKEDV